MRKALLSFINITRNSHFYRLLRRIAFSLFLVATGIYALLYLILSIPAIQHSIKITTETELSKLIHADVEIGKVGIKPFKQVTINNINVLLPATDSTAILAQQALHVDEIGAGISLYQMLVKKRLVFTYAQIIGLNANLWRDSVQAPLNIQPIIDSFKKDNNGPKSKFDVKIYNVVIRKSSICYDVLNSPATPGKFDKNHIHISNLTADVVIPRISDEAYSVNVKRLALNEQCGLRLDNISVATEICDTSISVNNFTLEMPQSRLCLDDMNIPINGLKNIAEAIKTNYWDIHTSESYITPADISPVLPQLADIKFPLNLDIDISGTLNHLVVSNLSIYSDGQDLALHLSAVADSIAGGLKTLAVRNTAPVEVTVTAEKAERITSLLPSLSAKAKTIIANCGNIRIRGDINHRPERSAANATLATSVGNIKAAVTRTADTTSHISSLAANISTSTINVAALLSPQQIPLSHIALNATAKASMYKSSITAGSLNASISNATLNGYTFSDIDVAASGSAKNGYEAALTLNDPYGYVDLNGRATVPHADNKEYTINCNLTTEHINPYLLKLTKNNPNHELGFTLKSEMSATDVNDATGNISINNLQYVDAEGNGAKLDHLTVYAFGKSIPKSIIIDSDILRGNISGDYNFLTIGNDIKDAITAAIPALAVDQPNDRSKTSARNNFSYDIALLPNEAIFDMIHTPVRLLQDTYISGRIDAERKFYTLNTNIPYLRQKNKLIENSTLSVVLNGADSTSNVGIATTFPVKRGEVDLTVDIRAARGHVDTNIGWKLNTERAFHGNVGINAEIFRDNTYGDIGANIEIERSNLVFNDTTWTLEPAEIAVAHKTITVDGFEARCDKQFIKIDGIVSEDPDDQLFVNLHNINLDYIFETLDIPNVSFGGYGTGEFWASNLFTKIPTLATECFHVENFAYNNCVLGNTDIASRWDNGTQGIRLDATISQKNGEKAKIGGAIYPTMDSLYLDFDVHHTNVQFLQPFMKAFTSSISGTASGHGTLFGNFKTINFMGDLYAEDFRLRIDYLNTTYSCTDSIHIRPDLIELNGITIKDKYGNRAYLNGYVAHKAFHDASMDLSITNARNLLCYDVTPAMSDSWYGTIFGNGNARIKGEPGILNIDVSMTSAPGSSFTFIMNKTEAADDYDFITFTDRNSKYQIEEIDYVPEAVRELKKKQTNNNDKPSDLNVTLQAEITPSLNLTLVMDPAGGDKIRATGSGGLTMGYTSADNDFYMRGKYTLNKGSYNFTLQDIIIKDFTIKEGSSITFQGNPEKADMDITAVYQLNASLTDLDDSFAMDKDLNRTNVPVQAVLHAEGDLEQPSVKFDLNFPTLTEEAYRKVKSIVSTDDMMNRQILYLIALNRFYTPEYMSATTNNNEFANVASSTISSQLSNILGQISDKWSIAPNFRTNKGDFSDIEVDVALSSQLLNNRLLLNGNFGYRDNSLNSSSTNFIGDFDIEYLLTRGGNIRLKAYNHYNDQNYYIKSALTTQGVGVVFKYDFNKPLDFVKNLPKLKLPPLGIQRENKDDESK